MDSLAAYKHKIIETSNSLKSTLAIWRLKDEQIVFTNGCFDVLHLGHMHTLAMAKSFGTKLIIGLNSDASVKRLKGESRPIFNQTTRSLQLTAFTFVDAIVIFEEDTPQQIIEQIKPNILVKGGDYKAEEIVGAAYLNSYGGQVKIVPYLQGFSTSSIVNM